MKMTICLPPRSPPPLDLRTLRFIKKMKKLNDLNKWATNIVLLRNFVGWSSDGVVFITFEYTCKKDEELQIWRKDKMNRVWGKILARSDLWQHGAITGIKTDAWASPSVLRRVEALCSENDRYPEEHHHLTLGAYIWSSKSNDQRASADKQMLLTLICLRYVGRSREIVGRRLPMMQGGCSSRFRVVRGWRWW